MVNLFLQKKEMKTTHFLDALDKNTISSETDSLIFTFFCTVFFDFVVLLLFLCMSFSVKLTLQEFYQWGGGWGSIKKNKDYKLHTVQTCPLHDTTPATTEMRVL